MQHILLPFNALYFSPHNWMLQEMSRKNIVIIATRQTILMVACQIHLHHSTLRYSYFPYSASSFVEFCCIALSSFRHTHIKTALHIFPECVKLFCTNFCVFILIWCVAWCDEENHVKSVFLDEIDLSTLEIICKSSLKHPLKTDMNNWVKVETEKEWKCIHHCFEY